MQAVCGAPPSSGTGQRLRLPQRHGTVAAAAALHLEVLEGGQQGVFCVCHQQARVGAQQGGARPRLHVDNMQASQLGPPAAAEAAAAGVQGRVEHQKGGRHISAACRVSIQHNRSWLHGPCSHSAQPSKRQQGQQQQQQQQVAMAAVPAAADAHPCVCASSSSTHGEQFTSASKALDPMSCRAGTAGAQQGHSRAEQRG